MNRVILMGRLTKDPETRYSNDKAITRFSLAVDRKFSQETDFLNIVTFGKTAEFCEKYFKKGVKIALDGRIQTGSYTKQDGTKVYTTDIVAEAVEFAESKKVDTPPQPNNDDFVNIDDSMEELPFN